LERSPSEQLELAVGRELTIRFAFTKIEDPTAKASAKPVFALFPDDLIEKWRRQQRLARSGKLRVRRDSYFLGRDPISADAIEKFLDETELSKTSDPAAVLETRFSTLPKRGRTFYEIIDDGVRRRNTYQFNSSTRDMYVGVDNGLEVASYMNSGQVDVFDGRKGGSIAVYGITEFCTWPFIPERANISGPDRGAVKSSEIGDRLTVELKLEDSVTRWVVDRKTGFVHFDSFRWNGGRGGHTIHQYGPTVFHDGVVLPRVHIKLNLFNDQVNQIFVDRIEHADLAYRPDPLDFVIAPAAGTVVMDYREDREHPKQGFAHYPPGDVIVYADGISSRNRQIEPVLKPGQPAPVIRPVSWLDRNGPIDPPDLVGKVVLIDFWGIACGPCVAELPEVQAAADHFAGKGDQLVLIGLHESGATVDQVATFAAKRALTYRLAIDRPAGEDGWFGAAFKAYGVRAIPSAAVIDRQGRIVFVGRFTEALQQAASLLEK
jgi:thiol-disulfide isomerase/thioredoxin